MTRQELIQQIFEKKTFLCVGLGTDIPEGYVVDITGFMFQE